MKINRPLPGFLLLLLTFLLPAASAFSCFAQQDESDAAMADLIESAMQGNEPAGKLHEQVLAMVEAGDVRDAVDVIEAKIAETGEEDLDPVDVMRSYRVILAAFARINNAREMHKQAKKLHAFQMARIDDERVVNNISHTLRSITGIAARIKKVDEARQMVDDTIAIFEPLASYDEATSALVQLTDLYSLRANLMVESGEDESALELCNQQYEKLKPLYEADREDEIASAIYLRMVSYLMRLEKDTDRQSELYDEHQEIIRKKIDAQPDNMSFAVQYMTAITFKANSVIESEPQVASDLVDEAVTVLRGVVEANPNANQALQSYAVGLSRLKTRALSLIKVAELMDKPAPRLDIESWLNGDPIPEEEMKGKVILLDFWAVWSQPSIVNFASLKSLQESYGDQGLSIVGVTGHYNLTWDEETERIRRSNTPVDASEEDAAITSFMENRKLSWPSIVVPDGSDMNNQFGVIGIPHIVLIDKQGIIRMVKVGGKAANDDELEAKIRELLAE